MAALSELENGGEKARNVSRKLEVCFHGRKQILKFSGFLIRNSIFSHFFGGGGGGRGEQEGGRVKNSDFKGKPGD